MVAKKKGLKTIAITDHGFNHKLFAMRRTDLNEMRRQCEIAEKQTGVKILLGVEANFISNDGSIDLTEEDYKKLDLIIVGHHRFVKAKSIKDQLSLFFRNNISKIFPVSKKKIEKNTNVYIQALKKYKINILSHINRAIKVDVLKVALAAKEAGTLVELNGKGIFFTDDEMLKMAEAGVKFILDSDAHSANRVGEVDRAISLITRLNIPRELIVNLDQLPNFDKEN